MRRRNTTTMGYHNRRLPILTIFLFVNLIALPFAGYADFFAGPLSAPTGDTSGDEGVAVGESELDETSSEVPSGGDPFAMLASSGASGTDIPLEPDEDSDIDKELLLAIQAEIDDLNEQLRGVDNEIAQYEAQHEFHEDKASELADEMVSQSSRSLAISEEISSIEIEIEDRKKMIESMKQNSEDENEDGMSIADLEEEIEKFDQKIRDLTAEDFGVMARHLEVLQQLLYHTKQTSKYTQLILAAWDTKASINLALTDAMQRLVDLTGAQ